MENNQTNEKQNIEIAEVKVEIKHLRKDVNKMMTNDLVHLKTTIDEIKEAIYKLPNWRFITLLTSVITALLVVIGFLVK